MYKKRSRFVFSIALMLALLTGAVPVYAESLPGPLYASGDFAWANSIGGVSDDFGQSVAVDSSGNVYTTGYFEGTVDFDPGPGTANLASLGIGVDAGDIFVSKFDSGGSFVWAKSVGGTSLESGYSIAVDSSGNVYTTGFFIGTVDFDPGAGTFNLTSAGLGDVFVSKLDNNGNFVWAKNMGGSLFETGSGIALDSSGNVYTTGYFPAPADFDPGAGTFNLTPVGGTDIFVSKLDNGGNFVWAKGMGGTGDEFGNDIAVDSSGNVYTTGYFEGTVDFDPGPGTANLTSIGIGIEVGDVFVSKFDSGGNFVWAKSTGGPIQESGLGIAVDSSGNLYTTGFFIDTVDFDPGAGTFNLTSAGGGDVFVSKLDNNGNFVWAKNMGGSSFETGNDIALDSSGNVYTTGFFQVPADFDPGAGTFNLTPVGGTDIFVSKLDSGGNFVWAKGMGGTGNDSGHDIAIDSVGNVYTTGFFNGTADFDPGAGTANLASAGGEDIFISKLEGGIDQEIQVPIDIIPGSTVNVINLRSAGTVPVAILSTDTFGAPAIVNKTSLTFGKTGNEASLSHCLTKQSLDVNGDGRGDLICYFRIGMLGLAPGDTQAILRGQTMNGTAFEGIDSVKVAGSKNP